MSRKEFILIFCVFLGIVNFTHQTLAVYNLEALGVKNDALLNISYSIANFGFAPFGKTMNSHLTASPGFSSECVIDENSNSRIFENSFVLIPRGDCTFVTKALNAQKLGAQLAIIMDDKQHEGKVIMQDNGYGYKVNIPAIFINHQDGEELKKIFNQTSNRIMMKITFENVKSEKVNTTLWLQANNRHTYKLVSDFQDYYEMIKSYVNLSLVYYNIPCQTCLAGDCYEGNKHCAVNYLHEEGANGKDILNQQIREEIVYKVDPNKWWAYMKYVGEQCAVITEYETCSIAALKRIGIDAVKVDQAYQETFLAGSNSLLKKNEEILKVAGIRKFPSVTINGVKMTASLNAEFLFDDICNSLTQPPPECEKYLSETKFIGTVTNEWVTILFIVCLGIIIFSLIFWLYRRYMKKRISTDMQVRVDDMVSKYIEFYSERTGQR